MCKAIECGLCEGRICLEKDNLLLWVDRSKPKDKQIISIHANCPSIRIEKCLLRKLELTEKNI